MHICDPHRLLQIFGFNVASPAGIFRGARISSLGKEEIRAPLKMPAGEARFNGVSSTAEGSVIGSEAERKRMLMGRRGGRGGAYWTPAGDSIEERASNVLSGTVAGFINKTNVCLIMFDGNSVGSLRSGDRDGNENGKKRNRFSASSHDPG